MRWSDARWLEGGDYFPTEAYYSTWLYFPRTYNPNKYAPWDPGDGGWWNVFQFKVHDRQGVSQPMWSLNVDHDDTNNEMMFYLYSRYHTPSSYNQLDPVAIPVKRWTHLEAYYKHATRKRGHITIWQDGILLFDISGVNTALEGGDQASIWSIGSYTDHMAGDVTAGTTTIFFDDATVSTVRLRSQHQRSICK